VLPQWIGNLTNLVVRFGMLCRDVVVLIPAAPPRRRWHFRITSLSPFPCHLSIFQNLLPWTFTETGCREFLQMYFREVRRRCYSSCVTITDTIVDGGCETTLFFLCADIYLGIVCQSCAAKFALMQNGMIAVGNNNISAARTDNASNGIPHMRLNAGLHSI
jgi:hypothetical protein